MKKHTTLSIISSCALALPHAAMAMGSGTQPHGASTASSKQNPVDIPVIPEYRQPGEPITANKMLGMSIMTSDGKAMGTVHNLVLDKDGKITHLIVDTESVIDGGQLIAIPWQLVERTRDFVMTPDDSPLRIKVPKSMVDGAPAIKSRDFPLPHADSSLKLSNHYFRKQLGERSPMD